MIKDSSYVNWVNDKGLPIYWTNKYGRIVNFIPGKPIKSTIWENPFIKKFFETPDSKWLKLTLKNDPKIINDPSWADILHSNADRLRSYKSLQKLTPEQEAGRTYILKVNKAIRSQIQHRGRPQKTKNINQSENLGKRLMKFIQDGMTRIKPLSSYSNSDKKYRFDDLEKFIYDYRNEYPDLMYCNTLKVLNDHFKKRKPLLKAIFACLLKLDKPGIKPESIIKSLYRMLNP